jgi:uncharacterized membrane protein YagU involved in acid resistance
MISTTEPPRGAAAPWTPLKAIVIGGVIAGAFDMSYALLWFSGVKGVPAIKVPQSIAGGLLGKATYDGGAATALLGICCHWFIALTWATVFVVVARRFLPVMLRNPIPFGLAYGAWIYFFMNWVVLPLDAMHTKPHFVPWSTTLTGLAVHMFGLGLAISLSAAKTSDQSSIRA